jgi:hypothetical protein
VVPFVRIRRFGEVVRSSNSAGREVLCLQLQVAFVTCLPACPPPDPEPTRRWQNRSDGVCLPGPAHRAGTNAPGGSGGESHDRSAATDRGERCSAAGARRQSPTARIRPNRRECVRRRSREAPRPRPAASRVARGIVSSKSVRGSLKETQRAIAASGGSVVRSGRTIVRGHSPRSLVRLSQVEALDFAIGVQGERRSRRFTLSELGRLLRFAGVLPRRGSVERNAWSFLRDWARTARRARRDPRSFPPPCSWPR